MNSRVKRLVNWTSLLLVPLGLIYAASREVSVYTVTNDSGADLTQVSFSAEGLGVENLQQLRAGETKWFMRGKAGNCGVVLRALRNGEAVEVAVGLSLDPSHGHFVAAALTQQGVLTVEAFPAAAANTTHAVARK